MLSDLIKSLRAFWCGLLCRKCMGTGKCVEIGAPFYVRCDCRFGRNMCPDCESRNITKKKSSHPFLYGVENPVELQATYPVYTCRQCGMEWSDSEGEDAQERAVQKHLAAK